MIQADATQRMSEIQAGVPLVAVEHITKVIASRVQATTILDDVSFTIPARTLELEVSLELGIWNLELSSPV